MRKGGLISGNGKYVTVFLVLVMLIGMIPFSSGTAEAWEANIFVDPQEVEAGDEVIFNVEVENTGAESMKVYGVSMWFEWLDEDKVHSATESDIVISSGSSYEFFVPVQIPTGILTDYNHDAEVRIDAADPDNGDWGFPERRTFSSQIRVNEPTEENNDETDEETDDEGLGTGTMALILIVIIAVLLSLFGFALSGEDEEKNQPRQKHFQQTGQQPSQQQSSVPPPTKQSSQQSEGQPPQQQTQQNPPPPPPKNCPSCNAEMRYVEEHDSWWCDSCQEYK